MLQSVGRTEADHQVINRLKDLSSQSPKLTVDCLAVAFGSKDASLVFLAWREQLHDILNTAIRSGNPKALEKAVSLINRLTSLGHTELRTLLRNNS